MLNIIFFLIVTHLNYMVKVALLHCSNLSCTSQTECVDRSKPEKPYIFKPPLGVRTV